MSMGLPFSIDDVLWQSWSVDTQMIETTSFSARKDEAWEHVDSNGHTVTWDNAQWVETDRWTVYEEEETYEEYEGEYRCPTCGEAVEPGWTGSDSARSFVPGLATMTGTLEISLDAVPPMPGDIVELPMGSATIRAVVMSVRPNGRTWSIDVERTQ